MHDPTPDFAAILESLAAHHVDFIVVGGMGAVLQGAPMSTFDVDIVHSRQPENVARLLSCLRGMDACYREQPQKRLQPTASDLQGSGHHLLMTRFGPLDILGVVTQGRRYEDLIGSSTELTLSSALHVRVLNLAMLIVLKEELARDKDLAVLSVLRRTLQEQLG